MAQEPTGLYNPVLCGQFINPCCKVLTIDYFQKLEMKQNIQGFAYFWQQFIKVDRGFQPRISSRLRSAGDLHLPRGHFQFRALHMQVELERNTALYSETPKCERTCV